MSLKENPGQGDPQDKDQPGKKSPITPELLARGRNAITGLGGIIDPEALGAFNAAIIVQEEHMVLKQAEEQDQATLKKLAQESGLNSMDIEAIQTLLNTEDVEFPDGIDRDALNEQLDEQRKALQRSERSQRSSQPEDYQITEEVPRKRKSRIGRIIAGTTALLVAGGPLVGVLWSNSAERSQATFESTHTLRDRSTSTSFTGWQLETVTPAPDRRYVQDSEAIVVTYEDEVEFNRDNGETIDIGIAVDDYTNVNGEDTELVTVQLENPYEFRIPTPFTRKGTNEFANEQYVLPAEPRTLIRATNLAGETILFDLKKSENGDKTVITPLRELSR
jgi:hypothetical protein